MNATVVSVSQINRYVKSLLDDDKNLKSLFIIGEISNFRKNYLSGHLYFSLKDENSVIKAVMFKNEAAKLKFLPTDGMKVICQAKLSAYEREGSYSLYVTYMQPDGAGLQALKLEQLKQKLEQEGLFDPLRKKGIPKFPQKIALITSSTGAAIKDVLSVHERLYPLAEINLLPVSVQGEFAVKTIIDALIFADNESLGDVILLTRGGGSSEDLSVFNDERLVRCVANCRTPIVSAVGHEIDLTLCDLVADLRAPTPSAAAEMILPDINQLKLLVDASALNLKKSVDYLLQKFSFRLKIVSENNTLLGSHNVISKISERLQKLDEKLNSNINIKIDKGLNTFDKLVSFLEMVSPLKTLTRGFAVVQSGSETVKSINSLSKNQNINVVLSDGVAICKVEDLEEKYV